MRYLNACPITLEELTVDTACITRTRETNELICYRLFSITALRNLTSWRDPFTNGVDFKWLLIKNLDATTQGLLIDRQITRRLAKLKEQVLATSDPALAVRLESQAWQADQTDLAPGI